MPRLLDVLKPSFEKQLEILKILVICDSRKEGEELGYALIETNSPFPLNVHTTRRLPRSKKCQVDGYQFDFLVFVMHLNKKSFSSVLESFKYVDIEYFLDKTSFVVIRESHYGFKEKEVNMIAKLEKIYGISVQYANFSNKDAIQSIASELVEKAEKACGLNEELFIPS